MDVTRRAHAAFNSGDVDALLTSVSPEVVWEDHGGFPDLAELYRGHDGVRQWYRDAIDAAWENFGVEILGMRDAGGGRLIQDVRITGTARSTGMQAERRLSHTIRVVDGLIVHRDSHPVEE
jgi:ketosteroid isomerase-like protein